MAEAMERKRNPSAKKALDYRVQQRYVGEYLRREVVNWRKKKQLRNQTYRTRIQQGLDRALIDAGADLGDIDPVPVRRVKSQRRFWGPVPLGEWVEEKLARRTERTAWNFFKQPYRGDRDREPFAAFLFSLTQGRSEHSRQVARVFAGILGMTHPLARQDQDRRHYRIGSSAPFWMGRFFQDEPAWEGRLRAWVLERLGPP